MDTLRLDVIYALRSWRRKPGLTLAAVLALALGIGANVTVFSFVSGVLLRPLPYTDPDQLVMVWQDRSAKGGPAREVFSPGLFIDWTTRATALQGLAAIRTWGPNLTGKDPSGVDDPERLSGAAVSGSYFTTLGVAPQFGRTFTADDDKPGAPNVVVLSNALWRRRFASSPSAIGSTVQLDGQQAEVIGVMPATFRGAVVDAEIWSPIRIDPANAPRGIIMLRAIARVASGATFDQAQSAMTALQGQLQAEDPELIGARARLIRLQDDVVGPVRPVLLVLSGTVAMVLLIACANVTSLLMARATERRLEISVRAALGADRARIVRQLLAESALLSIVGSGVGVLIAMAGVQALISVAPPDAPRIKDVSIDVWVLVFTAAITALAAVLAGLAPAINASRGALITNLREGAREARGSSRSRSLLVVAEVAAAMTLVVGAGLFVRSLISLQHVDLGFQPTRLLTASVAPPRGTYRGDDALRGLFDGMVERSAQLPGVESAALTSMLPLSGGQIMFNFSIEGRPPGQTPSDQPVAAFRSVSHNFFDTMGMRVLAGRGFSVDDRDGAPGVAVVNQALVKRYWPGETPIGRHIGINGNQLTIVGIVADVHHAGPSATADGELYVPYRQSVPRQGWLVLRTTGDPSAAATPLRAAMKQVDSNLPLARVRSMASLVADSVAQPRFLATLLTAFSGIAAVLALMGVYGLLSFSVSQRVREIGVRMALGGSRRSVVMLVLKQSLSVVIAGVCVGSVMAYWLSRVVRSMLFGVTPGDPTTIVVMGAAVIVASLVASGLPARRAAGVHPVVALRDQ